MTLTRRLIYLAVIFLAVLFGGWMLSFIIGRLLVGLFIDTYTEPGNTIGDVVSMSFVFIGFVILNARFFIPTETNKDSFKMQTTKSADVKSHFIWHMKTVGVKETLIFAAYSAPLMIVLILGVNEIANIPIIFVPVVLILGFSQLFYIIASFMPAAGFIFHPIVGYLSSVLFFYIGYGVCLRIILRKWAKKWYIEKEEIGKP